MGLESWRNAVQVDLLDDRKQSPIGDYLALQAVTIFLAEVGERRLRKIPNVVQETNSAKNGAFKARGVRRGGLDNQLAIDGIDILWLPLPFS